MYTRCPSCGAEISFEPPANRESLPEDYKHRIRCPICGVTIGVKINKPIYATTTLPSYGVQPVATSFEPVMAPPVPVQQRPRQTTVVTTTQPQTAAKKPAAKVAAKKSGVGRNVVMMIFSLIFVAISVVAYLINNETIKELPESFSWLPVITVADGITPIQAMIEDIDIVKALFELSIGDGIMFIVPMVLFLLAGINFIVALISAIGKKYGRAYNLIVSIIIAGMAVSVLFRPFVSLGDSEITLLDYFKNLISSGSYLLIAIAAWGVLQLIFSLFFLKSLKRKKKRA